MMKSKLIEADKCIEEGFERCRQSFSQRNSN